MINGREVAQMALNLQEPPRIPVTLIGGGAWAVYRAEKTFAGIKNDAHQIADVFVQYFNQVGHDLLWTGSNFLNYPIHFLGCPIKDDSSDFPVLEGTVIRSLDEMNQLDIGKVAENPTMQAILRSHHLVADAIGKKTVVMPNQWGPFTLAGRILGIEATLLATIQDPQRLLNLVQFSTDLIWTLLGPILEHDDVLGANFSDPMSSGDVVSPPTFRKFVAPALKDLVQRLKAKGKYSVIHICGNSAPILEDIIDIEPNCFSLENKVDLRTAQKNLGKRVCVAGHVSPVGSFLSGRPEEVIEEAKDCVATWGPLGGYIFTVGCDFPKNVPLENVLALMSLKEG